MEITHHRSGDWVEVRFKGRMDSYWSDHCDTALQEVIRKGAHLVRLNLAAVTYLSSAGIRVLIRYHKQLHGIQGKFRVLSPSEPVKKVLEMSGLMQFLGVRDSITSSLERPMPDRSGVTLDRPHATFDVFEKAPDARLRCRLVGDPSLLAGCRFTAESCRSMRFSDRTFAVGLGALGSTFADCQGRFGELLAVAGAAAYLPTDGGNVPDYFVAADDAGPELVICYAITGEGPWGRLIRFQAKDSARALTLTELAEACLDVAETDRAGLVMVVESAGLLGAACGAHPPWAARKPRRLLTRRCAIGCRSPWSVRFCTRWP